MLTVKQDNNQQKWPQEMITQQLWPSQQQIWTPTMDLSVEDVHTNSQYFAKMWLETNGVSDNK